MYTDRQTQLSFTALILTRARTWIEQTRTAVRGEAFVCVVHARPVSAWRTLSCCVSLVAPPDAAASRYPPTCYVRTAPGKLVGEVVVEEKGLRRACTTHKVWVTVQVCLRLRLRVTTRETRTAVRGEACVCVADARPVSAWTTISCCVSRVTLVFVVWGKSTRVAERLQTLRRPGTPHLRVSDSLLPSPTTRQTFWRQVHEDP